MAISAYPVSAGGSPIKTIQRGVAASAGAITISAVNTAKTMVTSFSTGSSGSVAATGDITGTLSPTGGLTAKQVGSTSQHGGGSFPSYSGTRTLSGGTTDLTSAVNGVSLTDSTTLTATGPCRYEVVEFN